MITPCVIGRSFRVLSLLQVDPCFETCRRGSCCLRSKLSQWCHNHSRDLRGPQSRSDNGGMCRAETGALALTKAGVTSSTTSITYVSILCWPVSTQRKKHENTRKQKKQSKMKTELRNISDLRCQVIETSSHDGRTWGGLHLSILAEKQRFAIAL